MVAEREKKTKQRKLN